MESIALATALGTGTSRTRIFEHAKSYVAGNDVLTQRVLQALARLELQLLPGPGPVGHSNPLVIAAPTPDNLKAPDARGAGRTAAQQANAGRGSALHSASSTAIASKKRPRSPPRQDLQDPSEPQKSVVEASASGCSAAEQDGTVAVTLRHLLQPHSTPATPAPRATGPVARHDAVLRARARLAARQVVGISLARRAATAPACAGIDGDGGTVGGRPRSNASSVGDGELFSGGGSGRFSRPTTTSGPAVAEMTVAAVGVAASGPMPRLDVLSCDEAVGTHATTKATQSAAALPGSGSATANAAAADGSTGPQKLDPRAGSEVDNPHDQEACSDAAPPPAGEATSAPTAPTAVAPDNEVEGRHLVDVAAPLTSNSWTPFCNLAQVAGQVNEAGAGAPAGADTVAPSSSSPASSLQDTGVFGSTQISKIARALERKREIAASPSADPGDRLDAVIQSKLLSSSRMLHLMRGQVMASLRIGFSLPMCSIPPGGPRGPTSAIHMVAIENTECRDSQETHAWQAVGRDCTIAAAARRKARDREAVRDAAAAAGAAGGAATTAVGTASTSRARGRLAATLSAGVAAWHAAAVAEVKRRREEAARKRIEALKSSDMQSYLAMVRAEKGSRLSGMLRQTDECLRTFARRLGLERVVGGADDTAGSGSAPVPAEKDGGAAVSNAGAGEALLESSEGWSRLAARLAADIREQPPGLKAQLREYQMHGVRWLVGLHDAGLNGILADDMGLGKTVQVIALITYLVEVRGQAGPFLIAAPSSVLPNWASELARWAPGLKVVNYRGPPETREQIWFDEICGYEGGGGRSRSGGGRSPFHVLLTSYEFLMGRNDRPRLSRLRYSHIIVDEGHRLKNAGCKLTTELGYYRTTSRLLLTGTPLQNRLEELWSLLNFLMPDLFDNNDDFATWFSAPLEALRGAGGCGSSEGDVAALSQEEYLLVTNRLHQVLRPFMLRRLKESVASELPSRSEVVLMAALGPYQAALMDVVKNGFEQAAAVAGAAGSGTGGGSTAVNRAVNNTVMEMRNICNHPYISKLHPEHGDSALPPAAHRHCGLPPCVTLCGKMDLLDRLLVRLHATRHKVLLFATMTRALDVVEEYLEWRGFESVRLDGSTAAAERGAMIADFNKPDSSTFIFLLSLKAGGVGLNLQAADTVILFDTDWNPQLDLQAQARAHRIGQTREVRVFRLLTADSIEQHIAAVAEEKRKFADSSITGGFFDGKTSAEERREYLLRLLANTSTCIGAGAGAVAGGSGSGDAAKAGFLSDAELNRLVARGEQELELLEAEDQRRRRLGTQMAGQAAASVSGEAVAAASGGLEAPTGRYSRLLPVELCKPLISLAVEVNRPKDKDEGKVFGRGMRRVNAELLASAAGGARPGGGGGDGSSRGMSASGAGGIDTGAARKRLLVTATAPPKSPAETFGDVQGARGSSVPARKALGCPPKTAVVAAVAAAAPATKAAPVKGRNTGQDAAPIGGRPTAGNGRSNSRRSQRGGDAEPGAGGQSCLDGSGRGGDETAVRTRDAGSGADVAAHPPRCGTAFGGSAPTGPLAAAPQLASVVDSGAASDTILAATQGPATATVVPTVAIGLELKRPSNPQLSFAPVAQATETQPSAGACVGAEAAATTIACAIVAETLPSETLATRSPKPSPMSPGTCIMGAALTAAAVSGAAEAKTEATKAAAVRAVAEGHMLKPLSTAAAAAATTAIAAVDRADAAAAPAAAESSDPWVGTRLTVAMPRGAHARAGIITKYDASRSKCQWYLRYDSATAENAEGEWGYLDAYRTLWRSHKYKRPVISLLPGPASGTCGPDIPDTADTADTVINGGCGRAASDPEPVQGDCVSEPWTVPSAGRLVPGAVAPAQLLAAVASHQGTEVGTTAAGRQPLMERGREGGPTADGLLPFPMPRATNPPSEAGTALPAEGGAAAGAAADCMKEAPPVPGEKDPISVAAAAADQVRASGQVTDEPTTQKCTATGKEAAATGSVPGAGGRGGDGNGGSCNGHVAACQRHKRSRTAVAAVDTHAAAVPPREVPKGGSEGCVEDGAGGNDPEEAGGRAAAKLVKSAAAAAAASADAEATMGDGAAFIGLKAKVSWGREGTFRGIITRFDARRARLKWLMSYDDGDEEWGAVTEDRSGWRVHGGLRSLTWVGRKPPAAPPPAPTPPVLVPRNRAGALPSAGPPLSRVTCPGAQQAAIAVSSPEAFPAKMLGPAHAAAGPPDGFLGAELKLAGPRCSPPLSGTITKHDPGRPCFKSYLQYDSNTMASYKGQGEWGFLEADHITWLTHGYKRRVLSVTLVPLGAPGGPCTEPAGLHAPEAGISGTSGVSVRGADVPPGTGQSPEASPAVLRLKRGTVEVAPDRKKEEVETEVGDEGGRRVKQARVGVTPADTRAGQSPGRESGFCRGATCPMPEQSRGGRGGGDAGGAAGESGDNGGVKPGDAASAAAKQAGGGASCDHADGNMQRDHATVGAVASDAGAMDGSGAAGGALPASASGRGCAGTPYRFIGCKNGR